MDWRPAGIELVAKSSSPTPSRRRPVQYRWRNAHDPTPSRPNPELSSLYAARRPSPRSTLPAHGAACATYHVTILQKPELQPITVALRNLSGSQIKEWNVVMAGTLIAALPTLLIYIIMGRFFIRGLLAGSVKG